jgi:hypothetical protein
MCWIPRLRISWGRSSNAGSARPDARRALAETPLPRANRNALRQLSARKLEILGLGQQFVAFGASTPTPGSHITGRPATRRSTCL